MISMPTKTPKETVPPMIKWFKEQKIGALKLARLALVKLRKKGF